MNAPRFSGFSPRWCAASACQHPLFVVHLSLCKTLRWYSGATVRTVSTQGWRLWQERSVATLPRKTLTGCTNLAACQPANGPPFHPPVPSTTWWGRGGASGWWVNRCYEIWKDKPNPLRIGYLTDCCLEPQQGAPPACRPRPGLDRGPASSRVVGTKAHGEASATRFLISSKGRTGASGTCSHASWNRGCGRSDVAMQRRCANAFTPNLNTHAPALLGVQKAANICYNLSAFCRWHYAVQRAATRTRVR